MGVGRVFLVCLNDFKLIEKLQEQYKKFPYTFHSEIPLNFTWLSNVLAKGSKPGAQIELSFFSFLQSNIIPHSSLDLYDLNIFEDCREVILHNVPPLGYVWCFLLIRFVPYIFSRSITEMMLCSSHCSPSGDALSRCVLSLLRLPLLTWVRLFARFLHSKVTNIYISQGASEVKRSWVQPFYQFD